MNKKLLIMKNNQIYFNLRLSFDYDNFVMTPNIVIIFGNSVNYLKE